MIHMIQLTLIKELAIFSNFPDDFKFENMVYTGKR